MSPFGGIVFFSAVETVTVIIWAVILKLGTDLSLGTQVFAGIALFIGYVIEHLIAYRVSTGKSPFEPLLLATKPIYEKNNSDAS